MKKTLVLVVALLLLLVTVGCFEVDEVETIQFVNAPESTYIVGADVDASDFQVLITTSAGDYQYDLTSAELVVTGLVGTKLDTSEPGIKTVKVTYKGVSVTVQYEVTGALTGWKEDVFDKLAHPDLVGATGVYTIADAEDLAIVARMVNEGHSFSTETLNLTADITLAEKPWTPIGTESKPFAGTFNGGDHVISNLTVVSSDSPNNNHSGLFGNVTTATISNLQLDQVEMLINSTFNGENAKNMGTLVGKVDGSNTSIHDITVTNATLRANGRVGGIVGMVDSGLTGTSIYNCDVTANLSAYNPVFLDGADGEGDKVGGIVGQLQSGVSLHDCVVNVIVNSTRDAGGVAGYAVGGTFENNVVLASSTVQATVAGGYIAKKGTCNAGGIIGTIASGNTYVFTNNNVLTGSVIADNVEDSCHGKLFGGIRRDTEVINVTINGVVQTPIDVHLYHYVASETAEQWLAFKTWQTGIVNTIGNH